jgi:sporulation related protein
VTAVAERGRLAPREMERCSACGAGGPSGQLICLDCGEPMALRPRRRGPRLRPATAALVATVLTAGVAVGLAIDGVNDGGRPAEPAARARPGAAPPPDIDRRAQATKRREERKRRALAEAAGAWPASRSGYTVVVANTGDRGSAERFARSLTSAGENAGVIASDEHPNLGEDLFLVYVGSYDGQVSAAAAAARLGESHPGAYPQFVQAR